MTDRALIENAAKAAGVEVLSPSHWPIGQQQFGLWTQIGKHKTAVGWWNPLTDDGDALRLAVKLRLTLRVEDYGAAARKEYAQRETPSAWVGCEAHLHGGIEAATRRAIVRAAAAIGAAK